MLDQLIIDKLRERYPDISPLLFHRSVERARSNGDLFDILDSMPKKFPVVWCEDANRWITTSDLYLAEEFQGEMK